MHSVLLSLCLLAGPTTAAQAPAALATAGKPAAVPLLERIAVIGASVSDGFGLEADVGARADLSDIVEASLKSEHVLPSAHASSWLFANTLANARQQIEAAKAKEPTFVVALDFLFWFGYGALPGEAARMDMLQKGLRELEKFACPVLVGDFGDMSPALNGESPIGPMLKPEQMPSAETLVKLNERLLAWAAERPNVTVVSVAEMHKKLVADETITIHGNTWSKGSAARLLQKDLLHPRLEGSIALWLSALEKLLVAHPELPASAFEWDAKVIEMKVMEAKAKEREAKAKLKAERDRKRKAFEEELAKPPSGGDGKGGK